MCTHLRMSLLPALLASLDSLIMCWWVSNTSDLSVRRLGSFLMSQSTSCTDCVNKRLHWTKEQPSNRPRDLIHEKNRRNDPTSKSAQGLRCSWAFNMYGHTWHIHRQWKTGDVRPYMVHRCMNFWRSPDLHCLYSITHSMECILANFLHPQSDRRHLVARGICNYVKHIFIRRVGGWKDSAQVIREGPES